MEKVYWNEADNSRKIINQWIRQSKDFHAIIDFDQILADNSNKERIKEHLHIGDWLHPNEVAGNLIAESVDLNIFSKL